jgi:RNA polymerase sigma factor (sigma-70 family)
LESYDWTLLERWARDRDAEAFAEIATRYAGVVYGACRRVLGDPSEAEDAAQECFLTLAQTRKPPTTNLGAWLHRVAVNKARDRVKSASRRRDRERRYMDDQPCETKTSWCEIEGLVDDAVAKLPEDFREALVAHFMRGQTHADIAERLGVSRQVVTYRIGKGVERIRASLRKGGIPIGAGTLTASLTANMAEAAPATLVAALGEMAVAGVPAVGGGISALTGAFALKNAFFGFVLCAVVGLSWFMLNPATEAPDPAALSYQTRLTDTAQTRTTDSATKQIAQIQIQPSIGESSAILPAPSSDDWATLRCTVLDIAGNAVRPVPDTDGKLIYPAEIRGVVRGAQGKSTGSFNSAKRFSPDGYLVIDYWKPGDRGTAYAHDAARSLVSDCVDFALTPEGPSRITLQLMEGAWVSGMFLDADGIPVPDSSIRAEDANEVFVISGETSADGQFKVGPLPPGEFTLIPVPTDSSLGKDFRSAATMVEISRGEHISGIQMTYDRHRSIIAGHVIDTKDLAVPGATVWIGNTNVDGAQLGEDWRLSTKTDTQGAFEFPVYAPNRFCISTDDSVNADMHVDAGTDDVEIIVRPAYRLTGTVLRADTGTPIEEFSLTLHAHRQNGHRRKGYSLKSKEGQFEIIHRDSPNVTVEASSPGFEMAQSSLTLSEDTNSITFRLQPRDATLVDLEGVVVDSDGVGISGAKVYAEPIVFSSAPLTTTESDGRFAVSELSPDISAVAVVHKNYEPAVSLVTRGRPMVVTLSSGGELEGTAYVGGKGSPGCRVHVSPQSSKMNRHRKETESDASGHYHLAGLASGTQEVVVRVDGRDVKQTINVIRGSRIKLDFHVPAADAHLAGHVYVDGQPARAGVSLGTTQNHPAGRNVYWEETNPQGAFRFDKLLAGPVRLRAILYGQIPRVKEEELDVPPGGREDVDFDFAPGDAGLEGFVSDDLISKRSTVGVEIQIDTMSGPESLVIDRLPLSKGTYILEDLPSGLATVTFSAPPERQIHELLLKPGSVTRQDIDIDDETTP